MKKLLMSFGLVLLLSSVAFSADRVRITYIDTISTTDSVATTVRYDTVLSSTFDLRDYTRLSFFVHAYIPPAGSDTNWVNDTFFVKFQHSMDKDSWRTWEIDTLLDTAAGWSPLNIFAQDSVYGRWGRFMFIHKDSMEAAADIVDNAYNKTVDLYIERRK